MEFLLALVILGCLGYLADKLCVRIEAKIEEWVEEMQDQKKLRDALKALVACHNGKWEGDIASFPPETLLLRALDRKANQWESAWGQAKQALSATTEETEMEKLRALLEAAWQEEDGDSARQGGITIALDIITTQFGYGEEEGDADREGD